VNAMHRPTIYIFSVPVRAFTSVLWRWQTQRVKSDPFLASVRRTQFQIPQSEASA